MEWNLLFLLVALAFARCSQALTFDDGPTTVETGKTYDITYSPKDSTRTTFFLMRGPSEHLINIATIGTDVSGGVFHWTVNSTFEPGTDYAIQIYQTGGEGNFSPIIAIEQGNRDVPTPSATPRIATPLSTPYIIENNRYLSPGAKAGIGVGAAIGGLALALGSFWIGISARRRRNMERIDEEGNEKLAQYSMGKAEIDGKTVHKHEVHELDGTDRKFEMTANDRPVELQVSIIQEMGTDEKLVEKK